jgi:hypothetical protein
MASTVRTDKVGPVSGSADFVLPTADGTVGQFLKTDGSLALGFATVTSTVYGLNSVQRFAASATWTRPTGVTKVIVEVQAAGGGGSSGNGTQFGGNGGGGSYVKQFIDVSSISTSPIVVGAAGAGGTTPSTGGTSSWLDGTNSISCLGGSNGEYHTSGHNDGGAGGVATASGATVLMNGQNGEQTYSYGGQGGDSGLGLGGNHYSYAGGTGQAPSGYGGGGGGGAGTSATGVAGGVGLVLVWEYK